MTACTPWIRKAHAGKFLVKLGNLGNSGTHLLPEVVTQNIATISCRCVHKSCLLFRCLVKVEDILLPKFRRPAVP
jgi:hypothetical protein